MPGSLVPGRARRRAELDQSVHPHLSTGTGFRENSYILPATMMVRGFTTE